MSALSELNKQILDCRQCEISKQRTRAVPGEGAEDAEIMFIGEAPGWHEDQQGRPFVGAAGQFLDQLLTSIDLKREQVYITNIVKTRPPGNRDPLPNEIENCSHWLERQIEIIHPKMIVTLGRYSMARFFPGKTISKIHGTSVRSEGIIYYAMYHPAAALHQFNLRQTIEADMKKIPVLLAEVEAMAEVKSESSPEPQSQQLNMFEGL
ncbi:uracil-DNA glycosylase family protein [Chloroflexota bacterium]